jgi:hypothetical protein
MSSLAGKDDPRLISFNTLRKSIGWFGIALPAAMLAGNYLFGSCHAIQDSNSHYYYTITGDLFVGILCAVAMFLLAYKGYPDDNTDNILTSLTGICALFVAFFPTNDNSTDSCAVVHLPINAARNWAHYGFSAAFFILLAFISYFLFTKSKGVKTKSKIRRNKVYRVCGVFIIVFIALIAIYLKMADRLSGLAKYKPVFWLEWFALIAFGFSWLIKGEMMLADKPEEKVTG